ncbi:putative RNA polymerase II subunit B1 CTD phosphatase RPAP2 [Cardamine amara subsp. amara]|uniref:RNA polymerase II subunit B1 CTD phosphatase RPAP2 homolog n=1 Tax=Cardamine amara subsp. amara TaxID=228776 RepID=A0ABD1B189_CARAN
MAKDQVIAINDAVHKLQLAMLEGITDQKQLFAAANLISKSDYEDVVTERAIAKLCGYPLCRRFLASEVSRRGKYRISLKEHKVYDIQETRKLCSAGCLIDSKAFSRTLQDARTSEFDTVKLNEILGLFCDLGEKDSLSVNEDLGLSKLTIRENFDVRGGDLSLEQWMGPSNAVEGYVPLDRSNSKSRNGKNDSKAIQSNKEKKHEDSGFSEMDFTSTVIFPDEYSVSKLPLQTKEASPVKESEDGKGITVVTEQTLVPATKKKSRYLREKEKEKKMNFGFDGNDLASFGFDELGCASSVTTNDGYSLEYSVSKQMKDPSSCHLKGLQTLDGKNALLGSSSGSNTKGSRTKSEKNRKIVSVEYHANSCEDAEEILTAETYKGLKPQDGCSSSKTITKSCLKISGSKKINRSVTWADKNDGCGDLCEVRNNDITPGVNLSCTNTEDVNSVSRLALAEACAKALSQAEAVFSGDSDASDAAAKAGIFLFPSTHQLDEEVTEEHIEEEMTEDEPTLLKWPNKPGILDSDVFDRDQSWVDGPPEGFNLTLSSFAVMWDLLFGWVSSSSLAYIYGKDESAHEEFLLVNEKTYPRKIIMGEWLSSEIKETVAGSLARALPRVATDLKLPVAISELEKGLGSLLETMSLTGAVPSFRVEQWLVIVLLFLEALSVSHIPRIAPSLSNRNKILEGSGIRNEEYEIMKDILLPLGRVPQFATLSGA